MILCLLLGEVWLAPENVRGVAGWSEEKARLTGTARAGDSLSGSSHL